MSKVKERGVNGMTETELVEEFQCPGCTCGGPKVCEQFKLAQCPGGGCYCEAHSAGTFLWIGSRIALGLPRGFHRYGGSVPPSHQTHTSQDTDLHPMIIRLHQKNSVKADFWDKFNVPVWALVQEGVLFVRTYCPRTNQTFVDVIEGGTLSLVPQAIDVAPFYEEMD